MQRTFLKDNKGKAGAMLFGLPILSILGIVFVGAILIAIIGANWQGITGQRGISQLCQGLIGGVIQIFPCDAIPFEAGVTGVSIVGGATTGTQTGLPTGGIPAGVQTQVVSVKFNVNALEKYLSGTGITNTLTINHKEAGQWMADTNTTADPDITLPVNVNFDYLVRDDDGSGTDYYSRWIPNRNSGYQDQLKDTVYFTREGTVTFDVFNSDGVTANSLTAMVDINSSQTAYPIIKASNNTAYSCFGNEYTDNKVLMEIDGNYSGNFSKISPFGIASVSGGSDPTHSLDSNSTGTLYYIVPQLNLCNGDSYTLKLKMEALSNMGTDRKLSSILVTLQDYTFVKNTDTGEIVQSTYNPVTNADVGATAATFRLRYE